MSLNNSNPPAMSGAKSHFMKLKRFSSNNTNEKENTSTSPKRPPFFKSFSANSTNSFMSKTQESSPLKKKEVSVNDIDFEKKTIFNTSLKNSLRLASAEVVLQSNNIYFGKIPLIIAKCGSILKNNALDEPGIFRIAGNSKKIKILEQKFSTPPKYGQDWKFEDDLLPNGFKQFSVHDVSGILRRYLNNLSEPLIPLACYNKFRSVLRENEILMRTLLNNNGGSPKIFFSKEEELQMKVEYLNLKQLSVEEFNKNLQENKRRKDELSNQRQLIKQIRVCLKKFEVFIKEDLEDCNKQTLVYLLDLLFLFSQHSEKNLMTAKNLAAIFQPSMISHPEHDMNPKEYELSRVVLEFLVNFSYKILPNVFGIPKDGVQRGSVGQGRRHSKSLSITMNDRENMELLRVVNKTESDFGDDASNQFDFENTSPELDQISVITREE
ncbi:uncharacterized protein HGUI_00915 [Hanseniaspora guilliermondii]|uniref:Rho-GAP domain-containing protein n=1 Tax=Hanseniaspora guilliermondii TaxID=56406 RepID=A0A1L0B167_9ASCO|nr:uncharacterized protein HGUI_00915 [Hanseniaspora guilliermondii]